MKAVLPLTVVEIVDAVLLAQPIRPDERTNMPFVLVFCAKAIHVPQRVCANDEAPANMVFMLATLDTSHLEISMLNDEAPVNIVFIVNTLDTSHLDISLLNDVAYENIPSMVTTLDTSHLDRPPLNDDAKENMLFMLVTLDTSHSLVILLRNDDA